MTKPKAKAKTARKASAEVMKKLISDSANQRDKHIAHIARKEVDAALAPLLKHLETLFVTIHMMQRETNELRKQVNDHQVNAPPPASPVAEKLIDDLIERMAQFSLNTGRTLGTMQTSIDRISNVMATDQLVREGLMTVQTCLDAIMTTMPTIGSVDRIRLEIRDARLNGARTWQDLTALGRDALKRFDTATRDLHSKMAAESQNHFDVISGRKPDQFGVWYAPSMDTGLKRDADKFMAAPTLHHAV